MPSPLKITLCLPLGYSALYIPNSRNGTPDSPLSCSYDVRVGRAQAGQLLVHRQTPNHPTLYDWFPVGKAATRNIADPQAIPYA